jgi:hypothetical protein
MRRIGTFALAMAVLTLAPAAAYADGFVSPWVGGQFGSSAGNGRAAVGINAGGMGGGIIGGEVGFGFSPSFWGTTNDFGHNTVIDLMGNLIVGIPVGGTHGPGVRPYATGGLGLIRSQIDGGNVFKVSTSSNQLGWNAGVGAMGYFNDRFGIRGDVRYFRAASGDTINSINFNGLHFWRISGGIVIR